MKIFSVFWGVYFILFTSCEKQTPHWPNFPTREVFLLDGTWDFHFEKEYDLNSWSYPHISFKLNATVPGNFDIAKPGYEGLIGSFDVFFMLSFTKRMRTRACDRF